MVSHNLVENSINPFSSSTANTTDLEVGLQMTFKQVFRSMKKKYLKLQCE